MSVSTLLTNDVILDKLAVILQEKVGGGIVDSITAGDNITVDSTNPAIPIVSMPIAGTWSATNNVVKSSADNVLEWGSDVYTVYTGSAPVDVSGTVISLPIAGTWAAGTNDVIKGSSATALFWANDNSKTYTATAPVDVTGTVISLPIAGTYSASNNVVKGSSATALEWGADGDSLTFSLPLLDTAGVVSLPIAGSFVAGVTDVVKGSASNALVWGSDSNSGGTVTDVSAFGPYILVTANTTTPKVSLNVGVPTTNGDVLTSTTAGALSWQTPTAALAFSLPLVDTAGVVSLPIAGSYSASNNVVKGSSATALEWGSDSNSGGTVTSVAAIANGYCAIAGTPSVAPTVGLNVTAAGTSGQYLTASGVSGQLAFITPPAPTVYTATAPVDVTGTVISLPIAGAWSATNNVVKSSASNALEWGADVYTVYTATAPVDVTGTVISLPISGTFVAGSNDVVKGSSATALQWGSGATAGVSSITQGNGISVTGSSSVPIINANIRASSFLQLTPTGSVLDLNAPACPTSGYVLSSTAGGAETGTAVTMSWVAQPAVTTAVYSPSSQSFASAPASVTPTSVSSLNVITMANLIMVMPSLDGFVLSTNAILPIGTVITLTITGLPTAGPLNQATKAFEGDIINSSNASTITSMSGQWTFLSSTNTYSYASNPSIVASGPSDTFIIYPPMLIYTST